MITAASTAFGRAEKSGASTISVSSTRPPVISEATGVRAPADSFSELADRLVETGMPWNTPGPDVRHPLRDRLLVHVDAVAVPRRERSGVAGGLREPDQQQRDRGDADRREVRPRRGPSRAAPGAGRPRGTWPTSATPCAPRSKSPDASSPRPRARARPEPRARRTAARGSRRARRRPRASVVQWIVAERPGSRSRAPATRCRRSMTSR